MAAVAVLRPEEFPQMGSLKIRTCSKGAASRRSSRSTSRPASRSVKPPASWVGRRETAPAGWTMCDCEADKDWILCDRVEAMAAELAAQFQEHLKQNEAPANEAPAVKEGDNDAGDQGADKEAIFRQLQLQAEEEEAREERRRLRAKVQFQQEVVQEDPKEEAQEEETRTEDKDDKENQLDQPDVETTKQEKRPRTDSVGSGRRASSRRSRRTAEAKAAPSPQSPIAEQVAKPVVEKTESEATADSPQDDKHLTRAERKAAWRAAQALQAVQIAQAPEEGHLEQNRSPPKSQRSKSRRGNRRQDEDQF
eukprot:TRINITY_DN115830_c0_g1_i1.p1 TRINITY_DN115830_c0_g1~~TRINITY_DN115830_c0_g1_i1.p1  ORF type:complete len:308 (-),score=107.41 TRINITY_DN115830_c0_g1_i1:135-1058(-)